MARYDESDLLLTDDGDILINERGDFALVDKNDYVSQSVRNRVVSSDPEWSDHVADDICANMEDMIGMPNNPDTAKMGIERISDSLTRYGLVDRGDMYIRPVPISRYILSYFVFIKTPYDDKTVGFEIQLNLETGVAVRSG